MNQYLIKKWLVVQIKPNSHDLAIRNLEKQGFETFLPKMKTTIRKDKKFIYKYIYVFPGYIFVAVDRQSSNWTKINSTYGVSKLLVFNNKPSEISFNLILALKNRYDPEINRKIKEKVNEGDNIKFYNGPFVDLIARVEAVDEQDRISLILEVMGANRKLKLQQTESIKYIKI